MGSQLLRALSTFYPQGAAAGGGEKGVVEALAAKTADIVAKARSLSADADAEADAALGLPLDVLPFLRQVRVAEDLGAAT